MRFSIRDVLWPVRWLRFSLRTLLVLTTLFAIWLGVTANRAREQAKAVAIIENELHGSVGYDFNQSKARTDLGLPPVAEPPGPRWLRRIVGPHFLTNVDSVTFYAKQKGSVTDRDLEVLRSLPRVKVLFLGYRSQITDQSLAIIGQLHELEALNINNAPFITDGGFRNLSQLRKLAYLSLPRCHINGNGLQYVKRNPIVSLNLNWTELTDDNAVHISAMTELQELTIQDTPITDRGIACLAGLSKLRTLHIHNTAVSDEGLSRLTGLSALAEISVFNTEVTSRGIDAVRKNNSLQNLLSSKTK